MWHLYRLELRTRYLLDLKPKDQNVSVQHSLEAAATFDNLLGHQHADTCLHMTTDESHLTLHRVQSER